MPKCTFLYRSACFVLRLHSTWELAQSKFFLAIDRLAGAKFEISFSCTLTTSYNMPKCTFLYRSACFVLRLHSTWELAPFKFPSAIDRLAGAKFEISFSCTLTTSYNMPKCTFLYRSACFVLRLHSTWELAQSNFPSDRPSCWGQIWNIVQLYLDNFIYQCPNVLFFTAACFVLRLHSTWLAPFKFSFSDKFEISFSCTLTTSYNMPKCTFLYRSACFVLRLHSTWELAPFKFSFSDRPSCWGQIWNIVQLYLDNFI